MLADQSLALFCVARLALQLICQPAVSVARISPVSSRAPLKDWRTRQPLPVLALRRPRLPEPACSLMSLTRCLGSGLAGNSVWVGCGKVRAMIQRTSYLQPARLGAPFAYCEPED